MPECRWENLECSQYQFQPIKLGNSVALRSCETQAYKDLEWDACQYCDC